MNFRILKGNIIDTKVDAIVLPANTKLKEGSGTSKAIFEAAGRKYLTRKCKEIGFCEMGAAVPTLGYNLECRTIIHAVVPKWIDGKHNEYNYLSSAYASALELADVMECKSIAFPLLASGNNKFDKKLAFEIAVKNFEIHEGKTLKEVVLVILGNDIANLIKDMGYVVDILPRDLKKDAEEYKKKKEDEKTIKEEKDALKAFAVEQIKKGLEYYNNPDNRERIIKNASTIVKTIFELKNI